MAAKDTTTNDRLLSDTTLYSTTGGVVPRIPLNLREKKIPLAVAATLLVTTSGILPCILYFIIRYGANASQSIAITVPTVIMGAYSLVNLFIRMYSLLKSSSTSRPIGATKRHLDYFQFNFIALFCTVTALIIAGSDLAGSEDINTSRNALRIVSMSLPVIMICVCLELVGIFTVMSLASKPKYPFRFSSMLKGEPLRPATYTIVEDVVAVDGKQGTEYRRVFDARYQASGEVRGLLKWADAVWGFSGVIVGTVLIVISWVVNNPDVGFVLGWIVPWVWAAVFTFITIQKTKAAMRKENARLVAEKS